MQRVEIHQQKTKTPLICRKSKDLYNYANYCVRQSFIKTSKLPREFDLTGKLAKRNRDCYKQLPAQTSQQTIKLLYKNWKSYFASIKDYKKTPAKYLGKPKLPKYLDKEGNFIVIFTNQQIKLKDSYIHFPKSTNLAPIKTKVDNVCQVRIVPNKYAFKIEVVYKIGSKLADLDNKKHLAVDLGVNNLVTILDTESNGLIVKGKIVKSINKFYNKKLAHLQSQLPKKTYSSKRIAFMTKKRNNRVNDYFHKTSRAIVSYCVQNKIANVVIGNNKNWKQGVNIGKKNNQTFTMLPHSTLIEQIKYKAEEYGISVVTTNESYTSKIDHLVNEEMKHQDVYKGKRIHRGLFKSTNGKVVNADINGCIGIFRKVIDEFQTGIINIGQVSRPIKLNVFQKWNTLNKF